MQVRDISEKDENKDFSRPVEAEKALPGGVTLIFPTHG